MAQDESQHNAELRQAFLKHLPKRVEIVIKRGRRLARTWDINAFALMHQDTQGLAGACGRYGLLDLGDRLFGIENFLAPFAANYQQPTTAQSDQFARLLDDLVPVAEREIERLGLGMSMALQARHADAPEVGRKVQTSVIPPPEFVARFAKAPPTPTAFDSTNAEDDFESTLRAIDAMSPASVDAAAAAIAAKDAARNSVARQGVTGASHAQSQPYSGSTPSFEPRKAQADIAHTIPAPVQAKAVPNPSPDASVRPSAASAIESTSSLSRASALAETAPTRHEQALSQTPAQDVTTAVGARIARLQDESASLTRVYHLSDGSVFSRDLNRALEAKNFLVETMESADDLVEMIGAVAPQAAIVDAPFLDQLSALGPQLKVLRQKVNHRVGLLMITDSAEITTRLKAMRAGADVFLPHPSSVGEVMGKLVEMIELESSTEPYRVMIIEDDRSQAIFAEQILRKAGMQTIAVTDPLSALDQLDGFRPELILMDLYMPGCDGMELTALIREREAFVSTPIVFLSGEHDADKRFDALLAGGDDYLEKPIRPKYLITSVSSRVQRARALARRMVSASPRDSVSGMIERSSLLEFISGKIANEDTQGQSGGVLFLLVDGAQMVRERAGLSAFDILMAQAGTFIASLIGEGEHCARYGDTSFLVMAPFRSEEDLTALGQTVVEQFTKHVFESESRSVMLAISAGIVPFNMRWSDAGSVINAAERAASAARGKEQKVGKHQTQVTETAAADVDALSNLIRDALKFDQFQLVFQPIASLRGSSDEQFQAFLRLPAPGGRLFTASAIIPAAEQAGVMHGVDRWTTARCLMVAQDRLRQGRPVTLFAPHSIESTSDPQRGIWLKQQLENRRVPGNQLVIEFVAADALAKVKQIAMFAEQMRPLNVRICLSHFDANMSSYQLLQHMRIDYIKISSRFLVNDAQSKNKTELRKLIEYARDKQIAIIATRVEDAQTAAMLWSSGVDYIQGNFVQQTTQDLEFDFRASAL